MKRAEALIPLSHQHHNALMGCLLIQKGIENTADKEVLKDFTLKLFNEDIQQHMLHEEKYVLPLLSAINIDYEKLVRRDHETLRILAERIQNHDNGYTLFRIFAHILEQHIRFEERTVFNKLQDELGEQELQKLQASLAQVSPRKCSDYKVKFWEK